MTLITCLSFSTEIFLSLSILSQFLYSILVIKKPGFNYPLKNREILLQDSFVLVSLIVLILRLKIEFIFYNFTFVITTNVCILKLFFLSLSIFIAVRLLNSLTTLYVPYTNYNKTILTCIFNNTMHIWKFIIQNVFNKQNIFIFKILNILSYFALIPPITDQYFEIHKIKYKAVMAELLNKTQKQDTVVPDFLINTIGPQNVKPIMPPLHNYHTPNDYDVITDWSKVLHHSFEFNSFSNLLKDYTRTVLDACVSTNILDSLYGDTLVSVAFPSERLPSIIIRIIMFGLTALHFWLVLCRTTWCDIFIFTPVVHWLQRFQTTQPIEAINDFIRWIKSLNPAKAVAELSPEELLCLLRLLTELVILVRFLIAIFICTGC